MSLAPVRTVLEFVQQKLSSLLTYPDVWGAPESVEFQVLLLLEVRLTALGASTLEVETLQQRYEHFLEQKLPGSPCNLSTRLGLETRSTAEFTSLLEKFIMLESTRTWQMQIYRPVRDRAGALHYEETT